VCENRASESLRNGRVREKLDGDKRGLRSYQCNCLWGWGVPSGDKGGILAFVLLSSIASVRKICGVNWIRRWTDGRTLDSRGSPLGFGEFFV
jgi:hypothetical protein